MFISGYLFNNLLLQKIEISVYNIERGSIETFEADLPKGYYMNYVDSRRVEWIGEKVLVPLHFAHGGTVLAYFDVQTRVWTIMDFAFTDWIAEMVLLNGNDLVIHTFEFVGNMKKHKLYKISLW
jgi:hypothetical protein